MNTEESKSSEVIFFRIKKARKENWKKICRERNISLTRLIVDSVENRIMDDERRKVIRFIEKQDNIFSKIETNINQVAKMVNGQKYISESQLEVFSRQLKEIEILKARQNRIFENIYALLSK
ncbi:plasmid mobilization relaxosome protein MobC [Chryseobacterium cheonjiense]|uniref:Plasmid mobilization relaxosome protein MobC n=1 Tax=Chryseobacterium cheonjiense TaxID=2728845 RepID=A0A7Y0A520_9FLAO|nr:plasmid mobilization relaxosome protein MobC [Chryseobacterium cheonjiense]NML56792.1 plasmid mobilization relaxosome protein MobC [Chryseobacterium cheonjiense]